jgi:hypothetical protein
VLGALRQLNYDVIRDGMHLIYGQQLLNKERSVSFFWVLVKK